MTASDTWVIGRGLLGSSIIREVGECFTSPPIPWHDPPAAVTVLRQALGTFIDAQTSTWTVYWSAGRGVTSSSREVLRQELEIFCGFLDAVGTLSCDNRCRGTLFFASSVGAAYGGSRGAPFTEISPTKAGSPYGAIKLQMENILVEKSSESGTRSAIGRISNLYGPGQDLSKGQGLISVLAGTYVSRQPARIFVSLDTLRDYLFVRDCARMIVETTRRTAEQSAGTTVRKILSAGTATSIGGLLAEFRKVAKSSPLTITGPGPSHGQALDLRVKSVVWTDIDSLATTTLADGINQTISEMRRSFAIRSKS